MGYEQWVKVTLTTPCDVTLEVKNAELDYGKWYDATTNNENKEVDEPNGGSFHGGKDKKVLVFASCGLKDSSDGTKGSVDIYKGHTLVVKLAWACPNNSTSLTNQSSDYVIQQVPIAIPSSGALGDITYTFAKVA